MGFNHDFQASSTVEYFSSEMIGQGVSVNTISSINRFGILKATFWCSGTL
jgi:hypothetical protein